MKRPTPPGVAITASPSSPGCGPGIHALHAGGIVDDRDTPGRDMPGRDASDHDTSGSHTASTGSPAPTC